jgi:hypothetical protein
LSPHAATLSDVVADLPVEVRNDNRLKKYYDEVIGFLLDVDSILILGPGKAKRELTSRVANHHLQARIELVQSADKMTDAQVLAHVRQYFNNG